MLIDGPLGNLADRLTDGLAIDWVDLSWSECGQRAMRKTTRAGKEIRILLRIGLGLRQGDVLVAASDSAPLVAVNVLPCELLVITPRDTTDLAAIAYRLGDLHQPIQLVDGRIHTPADGPVEAELQQLGTQFEVRIARFEPGLRSASQFVPANTFETARLR